MLKVRSLVPAAAPAAAARWPASRFFPTPAPPATARCCRGCAPFARDQDIFHYEVEHVDQIGQALKTIARVKPKVLVINGGDGTVQAR
jgi:hypothetical protein